MTDDAIDCILGPNKSAYGDYVKLNVHGFKIDVQRSNKPNHHFKDINLLGTDFLSKACVKLCIDYKEEIVEISE